jgi:protein-disulfide isomerase
VTIIEFSDYQCPYCEKWNQEVFAQLIQNYGNQVRFVYRDFPLPSHPEAQPAAEAADCAGEQGKYWDFHNKLFSGQQSLSQAAYQQYAGDIGLDLTKFNECVTSRRFQKEVEADLSYASNIGVSSTPTFFINGRPLIGAQPYASFKQVIDQELSAKQQ